MNPGKTGCIERLRRRDPLRKWSYQAQHLAPNDAMIIHQRIGSCDPLALSFDHPVQVVMTYQDPLTRAPGSDVYESTLGEMLDADNSLLLKGDAVVAYAEALKQLRTLDGQEAHALIDATRCQVQAAAAALAGDPDLLEIDQLLEQYRLLF